MASNHNGVEGSGFLLGRRGLVSGTSPIEELVSLKGWLTATRFKIFACGGVEALTHGLNSTSL